MRRHRPSTTFVDDRMNTKDRNGHQVFVGDTVLLLHEKFTPPINTGKRHNVEQVFKNCKVKLRLIKPGGDYGHAVNAAPNEIQLVAGR